jgi:fructokinase
MKSLIKPDMKVLSFGEILYDQIDGQNYLGGAPLNFAVNMHRLGAGAQIVSALGNDQLGQQILQEIRTLGLADKQIQILDTKATGTVSLDLVEGQAHYTIHENVAFDFIKIDAPKARSLSLGADLFYFGSLAQRNSISSASLWQFLEHGNFEQVFFDCNLRQDFYQADQIRASLNAATILKMNDEEVSEISRLIYGLAQSEAQTAQALRHDFKLTYVIITAGAKGAYVYHAGGREFAPGRTVKVADTVGAGDAFSAAFARCITLGKSPLASLKAANSLGAFVASQNGAQPEIPSEITRQILAMQ